MSTNTIKEAPIAKILEWWVSLSESDRDYLCINFSDKTLGELTGVEIRVIYESILINKDVWDYGVEMEFQQASDSLDILPLTAEEAHAIRVILIKTKLRFFP